MFDKNQLANLLKKAQDMQESFSKAQDEIANLDVTGESGGGYVKVNMNGKHDAKEVIIDQTVYKDKELLDMLPDLIAAAINDANRKIEDESAKRMGEITPKIPTDFKLPF